MGLSYGVNCSTFIVHYLLHTVYYILHRSLFTADCRLQTVDCLLFYCISIYFNLFLNFWFIVHCLSLLFTVYCLPFTVYRLPFTVYRLPFTVYRLPCFCTFFIVRLYPHTYNTYIIYLFVFAPPFFYCFVKDLLLLLHCFNL